MPADVFVEREPTTGATYCSFSHAHVATTRHLSDLVLVDLDIDGRVVGVEFAGGLEHTTEEEWQRLQGAFPFEAAALRSLG